MKEILIAAVVATTPIEGVDTRKLEHNWSYGYSILVNKRIDCVIQDIDNTEEGKRFVVDCKPVAPIIITKNK